MMLASPELKVALVTTHLPLSAVPAAVTRARVHQVLGILLKDLEQRFGIIAPRVQVCGLNPHAGEGGHLGREDDAEIRPAVESWAASGARVDGPWPADTAFVPERRRAYDATLAMYHDQGLAVLKALGFGESVNITLGLGIVRTSVDHGTALDLAGTGEANSESLAAAVDAALAMTAQGRRQQHAGDPPDVTGRRVASTKHTPRKRFGQHFLHDRNIIAKMVTAIAPSPGDVVLEIGPGQGALTSALLDAGAHVVAVEIDRDLAGALRETYRDAAFELVESDVLKVDVKSLAAPFASAGQGRPLRVVGNLPYNISTPLLFHMLGAMDVIRDIHIMVQKEVADRLAATAGSRAYGRLGVMVALDAVTRPLFDVPPGCFRPPPKVMSAVVQMTPRAQPLVDGQARAAVERVVRAAFSQRRKTLRRSLGAWCNEASLLAAGIAPDARPERVPVEQFVALGRQLASGEEVTHRTCG